MKVLLVDVNCKSGSTGKIVYDLYTQLRQDGHDAAICYGRGRLVDEPNIYKFSSDFEVYFHALLTRLTGLTSCFSFFSTRRLIKFIEKFQPDIVHLHDLHGYFVNIRPVVEYLKQNKIKTVWTFHCEFMYTGKCGHAYDCDNWKSGCGKCPNLKDYPSTICFDFTKKMYRDKKRMFAGFTDLIITTPSQWLADRVRESFLKDQEIVVVHNGIDNKHGFYPREFGRLKAKHGLVNERVLLSVAPDIMSHRKGGEYILELASEMNNENVKFILIGVKNPGVKLDDNVIAIGHIENQHELVEYYSMADVFVICSKKETFSMTCAEALSCGAPVVGFNAGAPETVFKQPFASFVTYGDMDSLLQELKSKLDVDLKKACVEYARQEFSTQKMYERYKEIYESGR